MLSHKKHNSIINVKVEFGESEGKVPLDNIAKRVAEYKPKERITYKEVCTGQLLRSKVAMKK